MFNAPGMCNTVICMLIVVIRNHRHQRRFMAMRSLEELFLIAYLGCSGMQVCHKGTTRLHYFCGILEQCHQ